MPADKFCPWVLYGERRESAPTICPCTPTFLGTDARRQYMNKLNVKGYQSVNTGEKAQNLEAHTALAKNRTQIIRLGSEHLYPPAISLAHFLSLGTSWPNAPGVTLVF